MHPNLRFLTSPVSLYEMGKVERKVLPLIVTLLIFPNSVRSRCFSSLLKHLLKVTALHHAADRGNVELIECLLKAGADVSVQDYDGQTPLHYGKLIARLFLLERFSGIEVIHKRSMLITNLKHWNV